MKKKKKSAGKLKAEAWNLLSRIIRQTYADQNGYVKCYTCQAYMPWKEADAGHGIPGRKNGMLFDERVIRPQGKCCNIFRNGAYEIFSARLMIEHGWSPAQWLAVVAEAKLPRKITVGEYLGMIDGYKLRLCELEGP